ncbi:hypothetical protein PHJA_001620100 [Phtheirospermum japonicum]|uniref:Uncharacterized protein n=1 Tax=Phtheirospermum japonicum TaxID=374723 RepID=A0A830C2A4_9LAMI|nr:hypothetical protein PHJA_001620100 [Phtheirospermum japonicum]
MLDLLHKNLKAKAVSEKSGVPLTLTRSGSAAKLEAIHQNIVQMLRDNGLIGKPEDEEKVHDDDDDNESCDVLKEIDTGVRTLSQQRFYYDQTKAKDKAYVLLQEIEKLENDHEKDKKIAEAQQKSLDPAVSMKYIEKQFELVKALPVEELQEEIEELIAEICPGTPIRRSSEGNDHSSNGLNETLDSLIDRLVKALPVEELQEEIEELIAEICPGTPIRRYLIVAMVMFFEEGAEIGVGDMKQHIWATENKRFTISVVRRRFWRRRKPKTAKKKAQKSSSAGSEHKQKTIEIVEDRQGHGTHPYVSMGAPIFSRRGSCRECGEKIKELKDFEKQIKANKKLITKYIVQVDDKVDLCLHIASNSHWTKWMLDLLHKNLKAKAVSEKSGVPLTLTRSGSAAKLEAIHQNIVQMLRDNGLIGKPEDEEKVHDDDDDNES